MSIPFRHSIFFLSFSFLISACASIPHGVFTPVTTSGPDYSLNQNWCALPTQKDSADIVPIPEWRDEQPQAPVDVFFLHPTTYFGKSGYHDWNASVEDEALNLRTARLSMRYQASVFNGAGKIYAPRYRQAHLECFYTRRKKKDADQALDLAYGDVRAAFQYYMRFYNQGRPFILAGHSQGTLHAARLLKEEIENTVIQKQLVVAYLPGMPVPLDYFAVLKPCAKPQDTGCFCSWRTYRTGYLPPKEHFPEKNIVVTNPVTWDADRLSSEKEEQKGAVLRNFYALVPDLVSTEVYQDLLWVNRPKFPWSFLLTRKNYHIADYNFFYADIRFNAQERVRAYLMKP
jgi:hypothetical protein